MNTVATMSPAPSDPALLAKAWRMARLTARFAAALALGVATALALTVMLPTLLGGQALTVMSGSMEPVIHTGDVVITQRIAPLDARVGDIVTFRSPEHSNRLLTHRVREIHAKGGDVYFVTKGDAVNGVERWSVPVDGRIGRTMVRVDKFGYVVHWINRPLGRTALLLVPVLLLMGYALARIWRPHKRDPDAPPGDDAGPGEPDSGAVDEIRTSEPLRDEPRELAEPFAPGDGAQHEPAPSLESNGSRPTEHGSRRRAERSALAIPALLVGGYVLVRSRSARKGNDR